MTSNKSPVPSSSQPKHFSFPENLTKENRQQIAFKQKRRRPYKTAKKDVKEEPGAPIRCLSFDKITLEYFANKGSVTAQRLYLADDHFDKVVEMMKIPEEINTIITELARGYREDEDSVQVWDSDLESTLAYIVKETFSQIARIEKSQLDIDVRICYAALTSDLQERTIFLESCVEKYPEVVTFQIYLCCVHRLLSKKENVIKIANTALERFPGNRTLLKYKATHCSELSMHKEVVDACRKVFAVAPCDYEFLPEMYYIAAKALVYLGATYSEVEKYYKKGLQAEKDRLPFLPPVIYPIKFSLEKMFRHLKPGEFQYKVEETENKKMYELLNYFRVHVIREYREEVKKIKDGVKMKSRKEVKIRKRKSISLEKVKFMTFDEFFKKKSGGFIFGIKCFVVEEAIVVRSIVRLVVEDEKGKLVKVFVQNGSEEIAKKFIFTRKISLLNPYVWIDDDDDENIEIWIGGEDCIIFEEGQEVNHCRLCWKKDAIKKCGQCKNFFYCTNECQEMDWVILKHECVCGK